MMNQKLTKQLRWNKLIFFVLGWFVTIYGSVASIANAQVVTPSFDPSIPAVLPMITGWRTNSSLSVSSVTGSGSSDNSFFSPERSISQFQSDVTLALVSEDFSFEAYYLGEAKLDYDDASTDGYRQNGWAIMASLTGDNISLGTSKFYYETDHPHRDKTVVSGHFGFGLGFRFFDWLYLGGGRNRVWEEDSDLIKNIWVDYYLGAAIMTGEPGGFRFRLELSQMDSPGTSTDESGTPGASDYLAENIHYESHIISVNSEIIFNSFFLVYRYSNENAENKQLPATYSKIEDTNTITTKIGIGWIPEQGFTYIISQGNWLKETRYQPLAGSSFKNKDRSTSWRISLAYTF